MGFHVGLTVGENVVGLAVGDRVVGDCVLGDAVGDAVGVLVGDAVGVLVGPLEGRRVGTRVGAVAAKISEIAPKQMTNNDSTFLDFIRMVGKRINPPRLSC